MKRLTPLPEHERCHVTNFVKVMSEGFHWCGRCKRVTKPEQRHDCQDDSRVWFACSHCGSAHHLKWNPPIFE